MLMMQQLELASEIRYRGLDGGKHIAVRNDSRGQDRCLLEILVELLSELPFFATC
jgi:hypothetical protein